MAEQIAKIAAAIAVIAIITSGIAVYEIARVSGAVKELRGQNQQILEEIRSISNTTTSIEDLSKKIEKLSNELNRLSNSSVSIDEYEKLVSQLEQVAEQISILSEQYNNTIPQIQDLQKQVNEIASKLKQLEDLILFPVEFTDGAGYTVVIPKKPQRIVSLAPSVTEILYYVNATDRLVGVDSYSNWPEWVVEARQNGTLIDIGGFWNPSVEKILAANPDLVIGVASATPHREIREILAAYGIPVVLLPDTSLDDVKQSILMVGKATGNVVEASIAAGKFEAELARFYVGSLNESAKPRVALLVWVNPPWIAGSNTFQNDMIDQIGAVNAFSNISGWAQVNPEDFLNAKPDIIVVVGFPVDDVHSYFNETLGDAALDIPAIANRKVYCIGPPYSDMMNRPSPRVVYAMAVLQMIVYPDLYNVTSLPECINQTTLPNPPTPPQP